MATILEFPNPSTPVPDHRRLERALDRLQRSLRAQEAAFAQWREQLHALDVAVTSLDTGLRTYEGHLAAAAAGVQTIAATSRKTAELMTTPPPAELRAASPKRAAAAS